MAVSVLLRYGLVLQCMCSNRPPAPRCIRYVAAHIGGISEVSAYASSYHGLLGVHSPDIITISAAGRYRIRYCGPAFINLMDPCHRTAYAVSMRNRMLLDCWVPLST